MHAPKVVPARVLVPAEGLPHRPVHGAVEEPQHAASGTAAVAVAAAAAAAAAAVAVKPVRVRV